MNLFSKKYDAQQMEEEIQIMVLSADAVIPLKEMHRAFFQNAVRMKKTKKSGVST